jgi:hypothetical protein
MVSAVRVRSRHSYFLDICRQKVWAKESPGCEPGLFDANLMPTR